MRWLTRLAIVAILLLGSGYVIEYEYHVDDRSEMSQDHGDRLPTVAYENLTSAERAVFDAARDGDGSVRRDEKVNGSHFRYAHDETLITLVERNDGTYAVWGQIIRRWFTLYYWGPPLIFLTGVVVGAVAIGEFARRAIRMVSE